MSNIQEFPKWKYHDTQQAVIVHNEDENVALGDGWRDTVEAAKEADDSLDKKEALIAELVEKGIAHDKRWGIEKLKTALGK